MVCPLADLDLNRLLLVKEQLMVGSSSSATCERDPETPNLNPAASGARFINASLTAAWLPRGP